MDLRRNRRNLNVSPRHLALRHGRRRLCALELKDKRPGLDPGEEQLFSFYVPGLQAGDHSIQVDQHIEADGKTKDVPTSTHHFNVIAPRFALPEGAIDSFYPPQGHSDRSETVPNVVFTDPTLPWERVASWQSEQVHPSDFDRVRVPWLAVLLFTEDELHLSPPDLAEVLKKTGAKDARQDTTTFSVRMLAKEASNSAMLQRASTAIAFDDGIDDDAATTNAIFLQSSLFNALFTKYCSNGQPDASQNRGHVLHHRFLAHLRHIHLDGTAAAAVTDEDDHAYSVVVGHRTGPLDIDRPTTVVAHLVNIEHVEAMSFPVDQDFVAMSSLHAWEYTCLPPSSLNIADAFAHLGQTLGVLRPTLAADDVTALKNGGAVGERVKYRIKDGFSMLRYRTQTGEITAAFTRSPFTATTVKFPQETPPWPASSTTGTKLQILDQQLNLMDLTYSVAWNLGKTLGLAHPEFASALSRVRKQIFDIGTNAAQTAVIKARAAKLGVPSPYKTTEELLCTLVDTIQKVGTLPERSRFHQTADGMVRRWYRPELPPLDLSYKGPEISAIIDDKFRDAAKIIAASVEDATVPYNEYNTPVSPDWMIVLHWVLDRYYLVDVPPHYLITDPSHVPAESLRFFNIDHCWVEALIDGGLSLANHLDQTDDRVRDAIKFAVNWYVTTKIPKLDYVPPIPRYGFFVRSALVTKFPDLIIELDPPPSDEYAPVILRHQVVSPDTMLCLMREPPVQSEFRSLFLREPPHQQCFTAARTITRTSIEIDYKRVYTKTGVTDEKRLDPIPYTAERANPIPDRCLFLWGTSPTSSDVRCLNLETMAPDYVTQLRQTYTSEGHPDWYTDPVPSAALMGLQLNEPQWQLEMSLPTKSTFPGLFTAFKHLSWTLRLPPPRVSTIRPQPDVPQIPIRGHGLPPFGQRWRLAPVKLRYAPPHFRIPSWHSSPNILHPARGVVTATSTAPEFLYSVFPVGKKGSPTPIIAGRQDLVFSIVFNSAPQNFFMQSLQLCIPLSDETYNNLMDFYTGAGPTMLSNLRFNVIAQFDTTNKQMVLTLKPRSMSGYVPVLHIKEMSFLLRGVIVHQYKRLTMCPIQVIEQYVDVPPFQKDPIWVQLQPVGSS
ncbi:hypothetical protein BBP40_002377 [Aspergillus hancockii]|nr:hypothetical protein BBP40_002377 [Aspergillus hancockii]